MKIIKKEPDRSPQRALTLRDAMNQLFNESIWDPFEISSNLPSNIGLFPEVDISETENDVKIVANVPGVNPEDINIEVQEDEISISGEVKKEEKEEKKDYCRCERRYGSFRRVFTLPAKVQTDSVKANSKNGTVTIVLPKAEEEKSHKIKINVEK